MSKKMVHHEHYYSQKQASPLKKFRIWANLRGNNLIFTTASGVFSKSRIDPGTRLLIETSIIRPDWTVLDLGCGYGAVGISIAKGFPGCKVFMVDVNERAVLLAKENAKANNVQAHVLQGAFFDAPELKEKLFDTILLNPPQTAGKDVCFRMIEESKQHLEKNGLLQLVFRTKKGGRQLSNKMLGVFGNLKVISKKSGYRVCASQKIVK